MRFNRFNTRVYNIKFNRQVMAALTELTTLGLTAVSNLVALRSQTRRLSVAVLTPQLSKVKVFNSALTSSQLLLFTTFESQQLSPTDNLLSLTKVT